MLFQATSFLALVAAAVAQSLVINTPPSVVQCQPAQITWTATNTPVFLSVIPGGQPGAAALQDFGQQTGSSFTWTVNIAAGTSITLQLRDSTGAVAYSSPISVQASSDSSCLGAQPSTSAAATSAVASPTSEAATSTPAATSAVASVSSVVSSAASSVSSVASSATAPATTSRAVTSSAASVISSATSRASTASSPAASPSSSNAAMPTAKVGIAGLLGLAAAVVMA